MTKPPKQTYQFHPLELSFVGHSNSGKTTLITRVIKVLTQNHTIGYVKHDAHAFSMDVEGKDTYRAWESGAQHVFIADGEHTARIEQGTQNPIRQRTSMLDSDFVIVEGYKKSKMNKIVVIDKEQTILRLVADGTIDNIVAFVGLDEAFGNSLPSECPYFHRDDVDQIAAFVSEQFHLMAAARPLYGLVLAGGYSTRMQQDKGLITYHDVPQADHCHHLLERHCQEVFVSTRSGQWNDSGLEHLPQLHDRFIGIGPMSGILTAMTTHPFATWVVLACDLPFVKTDTIGDLIAARNPYRMATSYLSASDSLPEPLCTIYEPKVLVRLLEGLALGCRCPRKILCELPIKTLTLKDERALDNINSKDDLLSTLLTVREQ